MVIKYHFKSRDYKIWFKRGNVRPKYMLPGQKKKSTLNIKMQAD